MPPDMTTLSASVSVSLLARLGTKPIAPRSIERITSALRSDAETTTTGIAGQPLRSSTSRSKPSASPRRRSSRTRSKLPSAASASRAARAPPTPTTATSAAHALDHVLQRAEDQRMVVDQEDFHGGSQAKRRPTDSAMQTGLSLPSRSIATSNGELRAAFERLVTSNSLKWPRTRLPLGTGAGKRTLFRP